MVCISKNKKFFGWVLKKIESNSTIYKLEKNGIFGNKRKRIILNNHRFFIKKFFLNIFKESFKIWEKNNKFALKIKIRIAKKNISRLRKINIIYIWQIGIFNGKKKQF